MYKRNRLAGHCKGHWLEYGPYTGYYLIKKYGLDGNSIYQVLNNMKCRIWGEGEGKGVSVGGRNGGMVGNGVDEHTCGSSY